MKPTFDKTVKTLEGELAFLDGGGYHPFVTETGPSWRQAAFFENTPSCPKKRYCRCDPESDCVLLNLVPVEHQHEPVPCRHIRLNERGDTINSLQKTAASNKEIETILRPWLLETITGMEGLFYFCGLSTNAQDE